jgi:hypothetical protein
MKPSKTRSKKIDQDSKEKEFKITSNVDNWHVSDINEEIEQDQ